VDAYQDVTIPFQMSSVEFFSMVSSHLKEDGVMVVNMNMRSNAPGNINDYLADTIASKFEYVYRADVEGNTNRELFASNNPAMISNFERGLEAETDPELTYMMSKTGHAMSPYIKGDYILTDDKAPVELLGMRLIDALIQDEVGFYKSVYEAEGIGGLMKYL